LPTSHLVIAGILVLAVAASPSDAAKRDAGKLEDAEALAIEAKAYFKGKLFEKAAEKFMKAFAISHKPALAFNAARAHEEGKKPRQAIAIFQMYAGLRDSSRAGKRDARRRIKALKKIVKAQDEAAKKAAAAKAAADKVAADNAAAARAKAAAAGGGAGPDKGMQGAGGVVSKPAPAPEFPIWRTAGGGALTVFALVAWLNANSLSTEMPEEDVTDQASMARYLELADDARLWQGVAIGSAIVGVGVLAWGQLDYWWLQRGDSDSALRVLPTVHRDGIGWSIRGSF